MCRSKYMHRYIAVAVLLWVVEAQAVEIQGTYQVHADRNSASQIYYVAGGAPDFVSVPLDTKIEVTDGDRITVMAEGSWGNSSDLTFGPGGNPHENIASGYPGAGMPVAALIGRFGDGRWFYVGTGMTGTVSGSGLFTLAFNDTDYGNNWGTVTVTVTVNLESKVYRVECEQDTGVTTGTQWANQTKTNQGINYLLHTTIANDGYRTKHISYLGFNLTINPDFVQGLADGEAVVGYKLWAYSDHNFAQGDAVTGDVKTGVYYASNDQWREGTYWSWTVIDSPDPLDGMTWDNQVGYSNLLATEYQNDYQGWYKWEFSPGSFTVNGPKDNSNYLTLALVPNGISKTSSWWLVTGFASTEYHNSVPIDYRGNLVPYLEVVTTSATVDLPPNSPTGLTATSGNETVSLDWNDNTEADLAGYNIYRSLLSGGTYSQINTATQVYSQYQDTGLTNGVTYYYVVKAVDIQKNEGTASSEVSVTPQDSIPPLVPTGLTSSAGNTTVSLDWNNNTESDLSGYNVYRSSASGSGYNKINTSTVTASQYNDSGLTNGTTYYYVVTAVDFASNESSYSSQVSAKPMSNPPTATASATPTSGTAPLAVSFTGSATDDGSITKYEWDFDGNGTYDWSSNTGGNTVKTYSSAGTWTANFRVTDNDSLTATASVTITVSSPPVDKKSPTASISASSTSGTTPLTVTFTYSGTDTDGTIKQYEMDFDGNGTYDFVSTSSGSVSYIYGQGGSYTATLRVTDNDGLSGTASVTISVSNPTNTNPLVADANCSPSSVTVGEIVTLTGSAIGGSGSYIAYIWDYEGDGEYDWASTTGTTTHVYDKPGSYSPTVMVVDSNGLTDTDSVALTVSSPSNLKVWISVPKNGDSIWGTDVTLHANTAPGNLTKSVKFQYKGVTTDWTDIGSEMFPPPNSFFSTTWNVTGLTEGDYQLRAVGKDTSDNTVNSEIITVTVTQTNPDVNDGVDNSGNREKKQKIDKDETTESSMEDYTSVEIPYGTLTQDATLTVTALPANPQNTTEGANSSLDKFRKIELEGNPTLEKSVTVTIPYDDTDNNGIVDGTNIPEKDLKLWWYNTTTGKWEKISDTEVDTTNKQVKAKVGHLSDFAIGSEDTAAPSAPSGLSATAGDGQVSLTWTNPADTDFAGVKVIRKTGGYPASVTDGTEVYSGTGTSKTDTGLTNGTACYYTIFAYDEVPNYSTGAQSSATPQGSSGGGGGGGGGCFIATAAYGTPMASDVVTLSRFRDTHLLTNPIGKRLVAFYYRMSPPIADFIARHEYLRSMVRFILKPVVGLVN